MIFAFIARSLSGIRLKMCFHHLLCLICNFNFWKELFAGSCSLKGETQRVQRKACDCGVPFTKEEYKCEHTSSTKNGPPDQHIYEAFNPHTAFNFRECFSLLRSLQWYTNVWRNASDANKFKYPAYNCLTRAMHFTQTKVNVLVCILSIKEEIKLLPWRRSRYDQRPRVGRDIYRGINFHNNWQYSLLLSQVCFKCKPLANHGESWERFSERKDERQR